MATLRAALPLVRLDSVNLGKSSIDGAQVGQPCREVCRQGLTLLATSARHLTEPPVG
jgi:hypothetical protein